MDIEDIQEAIERLKRIEEKLDILLDVLGVELDSLDHDPLSYELYRDDV